MRTSSRVSIPSRSSRSSSTRHTSSHSALSFKRRAFFIHPSLCHLRTSSGAQPPTTGARTTSCEQRIFKAFPRNSNSSSSTMLSSGYQHSPWRVSISCFRASLKIAGHSILLLLPAHPHRHSKLTVPSSPIRLSPSPSLHGGIYLPGYSSATLLTNVPLPSLYTLLGLAPSRDFISSLRVTRIRSIFNHFLAL